MERLASLFTGMDRTPGSGCGRIFKGDLNADDWLIEVKSTRAKKLTLNSAWWFKAKDQAREKYKENFAVIFGWTERANNYKGSLQFALVRDCESVPRFVITLTGKTKALKNEELEQLSDRHVAKVVFQDGTSAFLVPIKIFQDRCIEQ